MVSPSLLHRSIASFAVSGFGCCVLRFWLTGVTLDEVTIMALFMGVSSLAFAFHAMSGMYLHAERHLAKAGVATAS